jgi:hypothetical protein
VAWAKDLFDATLCFAPAQARQLLLSGDTALNASSSLLPLPLRAYLSVTSAEAAERWAHELFRVSFTEERLRLLTEGSLSGDQPWDDELVEAFLHSARELVLQTMSPASETTGAAIKAFDKVSPTLSSLSAPQDDLTPAGHVAFLTAATNLR